jgi:hypothetical protein
LFSAITEFPLPSTYPLPGEFARDLTVGPDGNLWFTETPHGSKPGSICRLDLAPRVTKADVVTDSQGAITSILISFDKALNPASAGNIRLYAFATEVKRGQTTVYSKRLRIAGVSYDRAAHAVRLKLAVPQKGPIQVTVRAGLVANDGTKSSTNCAAVVM